MKRKNYLAAVILSTTIMFTGCTAHDTTVKMSVTDYNNNIAQYEKSHSANSTSQSSEIPNFYFVGNSSSTTDIDLFTPESTSSLENTPPNFDKTNTSEYVKENTTKEITISFLGDCTLGSMKGKEEVGNMVNYLNTKKTSYFFEKCMPYIGSDDFTIANCETVFSDYATTGIAKSEPAFWFRSSTKNAFVFSDNSIDAVSLANNHTNDYGADGFAETKKALDNANVMWGDNLQNVIYLEKYDIRIGIICAKFYDSSYENAIVEKIKEVSVDTDIQVVFFHGGTEKIHTPEEWKIKGCHSFIDNGADLVIGGHPHVLQPYEEYNGKSIIYSLGNFCYGGHRHPENKTIIYQHTFTFDIANTLISDEENMIPFYVYTGDTNNWQPSPIENQDEQNEILDFLYNSLKK